MTSSHFLVSCCALAILIGTGPTACAQEGFWLELIPSRTARLAQAESWKREFVKLDRQVPTLSPSEAAWLKREYDDQIVSGKYTLSPRALAAMNSREFDIRSARRQLDTILTTLDAITASDPKNLRKEVEQWATLASLFMDVQFWLSMSGLVKRGLVGTEINHVKDIYLENHVSEAQRILEGVVLPFLGNRLK